MLLLFRHTPQPGYSVLDPVTSVCLHAITCLYHVLDCLCSISFPLNLILSVQVRG